MHPHLTAALQRLELATRDLRTAAEAIPASLQGHKPDADCWSVNELLEHLGLVEQSFVTTLIANVEAAAASGLHGEVDEPEGLAEHLRTSVEDRSTKRTAPDRVKPTGNLEAAAALQILEDAHRRLRATLESAEGVALSAVTHEHRVFGKLNVYQWIDFLAGHERRHLAQLREIGERLERA